MLNIECVDCTFTGVDTDCRSYGGCETCDYGSSYINEISFNFNVGRIDIEVEQMYGYPLSEGQVMEFLLNNMETIKASTFDEICKMFKKFFTGFGDSLDFKVVKR